MTSKYRAVISRGDAPIEFVYHQSESLRDALFRSRTTIRDKQMDIFRELSEEAVKMLTVFTPVASGNLARSTNYAISMQAGSIPELVSTITQDAQNYRWGIPYRAYVGQGTRPHRPPIDPIQQWVSDKFGYFGARARSMAGAIVHNINIYGLTPNPYVYMSLESLGPTIERAAEKMGTTIVTDFYDSYYGRP